MGPKQKRQKKTKKKKRKEKKKKWSENVECTDISICRLCVVRVVLLLFRKQKYGFDPRYSFSGRSHFGSLVINEEQKKARDVTYTAVSHAGRVHGVKDLLKMAALTIFFSNICSSVTVQIPRQHERKTQKSIPPKKTQKKPKKTTTTKNQQKHAHPNIHQLIQLPFTLS